MFWTFGGEGKHHFNKSWLVVLFSFLWKKSTTSKCEEETLLHKNMQANIKQERNQTEKVILLTPNLPLN